MARSYSIVNDGTAEPGLVHPGATGRWFFQVTAYASLDALTPQMSVDGTTWLACGITPYSLEAAVITITATGGWIADVGCNYFRLIGVGTGTATVVFQPAVG